MQKLCDLFLCEPAAADRLGPIRLFDRGFLYSPEKQYLGYLHINIYRVKLVPIVSDIRKGGTACFSVPIEYRDRKNVPIEHAIVLASDYAKTINASIAKTANSKCPPIYWSFDLLWSNPEDERAGGAVMIDKLDGHVWTSGEYEEYMYDYNNIF